jgi:hypothetical protein
VLAQLLDFFVGCDLLKTDFSSDLPVYAEYRRNFLLCQEEDLEHEVIAFVGAAAHAGLAHQDHARQQNRFKGYDGPEKRIRWWIEMMREGEGSGVEHHPSSEDCEMDADERKASCEAGDGVPQAFRCGAIRKEILFVFCNQVYVVLDVALGHAY